MTYDEILEISIKKQNGLNENSLKKITKFLNELHKRGWYPFLLEWENIEDYRYMAEAKKDWRIFELLMFEKTYKECSKKFFEWEDKEIERFELLIREFKKEIGL